MPFIFLFMFLIPLAGPLTATASQVTPPAKDSAMPTLSPAASDLVLANLPNGLTVAVKKDARFPLASLRLYVHAGSAYEKPDQAGISHQLEHMVFKGTESRPKGAVAADIERAGGYLNAATSFDYTVYLTDMPSSEWKLGMDVLKDMAFHPSLDAEELESEKKVVLAELQRGEDSPSGRLFKRVQAMALKGTPYERPIIGFPETIRNYSVKAIKDYIGAFYQPRNMLLLVVGDVDPEEVMAEAQRLFGDIPNTATVVPPVSMDPRDFPSDGPSVVVERTPWNKVYLTIAFPGVAQNDARSPALDLLAQMLGGDTSSYLHQTYKYQKRLVDSISASSYSFERTGLFLISASMAPDKLDAFWNEFVKDLPALGSRAFSSQEMDRAKLAITDSLFRQKETVAGIASSLGYFLFLGGGPEAERQYMQLVAMTDAETVRQAAASVLQPERLAVTALLPQEDQGPAASEAALGEKLRAAWHVSSAQAAPAPAEDFGLSREVIDLGQGRTLILLPDTSMPYAAVTMAFNGGDSLLPPDKQGLAALTAAVLTKGTKTRDSVALEAFKNDRAASLGAAASRETFALAMNYPAQFADDMWALFQETLTSPTLPEDEVSRSRDNQAAAIVAREDQPLDMAFRRIFPFLFGDHLYGYQSLGSREGVSRYLRQDVAGFWKSQVTRPWALSVCGTFDRESVIRAAKALPVPAAPRTTVAEPAWTAEKSLTIPLPDREQAHLLLVFPGAGQGSQDEPGLDLLQNILSGQSGLLFRDLRDNQGLGYTVTALQWQAPLTGSLIFYIGTEPDKLETAYQGFATVIKGLHDAPLPEDELTRGKNQMRGSFVRARQKMSARSAEAASLAVQGRPLDAEKQVVDTAQSLTGKDLQALARKYLNLDKAYTVTVVPQADPQ